MKKRLLIASAITVLAGGAQADGDQPAPRATSVAEMLQTKHLREQLAREGRFDEIRRLDEEKRQQQREQQDRLYSKLNNEIGSCEAPANGDAGRRGDEQASNTSKATPALFNWLGSLLSDATKSK